MSNSIDRSLHQAATSTFESLGFLMAVPELRGEHWSAAFDASVAVDFRGPLNGELVLRLYGGVLPALAANMLGQNEPPATDVQWDALGETANVICGNLLPEIADPAAVFVLGVPRPSDAAAAEPGSAAGSAVIGLESGRAELELRLLG